MLMQRTMSMGRKYSDGDVKATERGLEAEIQRETKREERSGGKLARWVQL